MSYVNQRKKKVDEGRFQTRPGYLHNMHFISTLCEDITTNTTLSHDDKLSLVNIGKAEIWVSSNGGNYAGGDSLEIKLYVEDSLFDTVTVSTPAISNGEIGKVSILNSQDLSACDQISIAGTVTIAGSEEVTVRVVKWTGSNPVVETDLDGTVQTGDSSGSKTDDTVGISAFDRTNNTWRVVDANDEGRLHIAGYREISEAVGVQEIDPLSEQYVYEEEEDTNIPDDSERYVYFSMDGVKHIGIQCEVTTGTDDITLTLEGTAEPETDAELCTYQDITTELTGSASFTNSSEFFLIDTPLPVRYLRLKYVTSADGGNDTSLTVYSKKLY